MSSWQNAGTRRRRVKALSAAMKRSAEARRCPKCSRGAALVRITDGLIVTTACRWGPERCDYVRVLDLSGGEVSS